MSGFDTSWRIDKYFSPHEPKHHWELRRKFMELNKDRYPETRLVCLAQTFANIEFLGCRYPKETMDLVEDLAFGVVQEYREQQKTRLKRTFVSGSDAAGAKVNRTGIKRPIETSQDVNTSGHSQAKQPKLANNKNDPLSAFFIVKRGWQREENPMEIIVRSASFSGVQTSLEFETLPGESSFKCKVLVDSKVIACASKSSKKEARLEAGKSALEKLSEKCFTIVVKQHLVSDDSEAIGKDLLDESNDAKPKDELGSENVGFRLLKLMGWTGGGLGKEKEGISEPITAAAISSRAGLGSQVATKEFQNKVRRIIGDYAKSSNPNDLVFTTGFNNDQRKFMHLIARKYGLKSKSYGKDDDRYLTISRKINPMNIVSELVARGQSNERYEVIPPQKTN